MSIEAQFVQCGESIDWTADADYSAGDVIQLPDGRAGVVSVDVASGNVVGVYVSGIFKMAKTTSMVMLIGSWLYWDHSANKCHLLHGGDKDFFLGSATEDGTSAGTTIKVNLNIKSVYTASLENGFKAVKIETAGFVMDCGAGKYGCNLAFSATAEAQKADALSFDRLSVAAVGNSIVDALISINDNGDATAMDVNIGIANGTHATDADSITEALFAHFDGNDVKINLASRDGTTTVASTDTTITYTEGTPFLVQWDCRDLTDIQTYVNGVLALPSTVFKLNAATGPLMCLAHLEKSSDDTPGNVSVLRLGIRSAQDI